MAAITTKDILLDHIIRRFLALRGIPLHYYFLCLIIARRLLDDMLMHSLQKCSYAIIPIGANNEGTLPSDYVDYIDVYLEVGDKKKSLGYNDRLNERDNSGASFPISADQLAAYSNPTGTQFSPSFYNEYGDNKGRNFGSHPQFYNSFVINRESGIIRVDNKSGLTSVTLQYLTLPTKNITNQSVIHPNFQNAMIDGIKWKFAEWTKDKDALIYRKEYFNSLRIARASLNKMTVIEIMRSLRRQTRLTVKG